MRFHGFVSKSEVDVLVWGIVPQSEWPKQRPMISKQNHENKRYKVIIITQYTSRDHSIVHYPLCYICECTVDQTQKYHGMSFGWVWPNLRLHLHSSIISKAEILYCFFTNDATMHEHNVEFGNFIPAKFAFWREIFAILRGNLLFRWIFCTFLTQNSKHL